MSLARKYHPGPILQRLRTPRNAQDAKVEGKLALVLEILEGYDGEFDWAYRNFQWGKQPKPQDAAGGGIGREPRRAVPVCSLVAEMDQILPAMAIVAFPIWNRNPVRHLEGVPQDSEIGRITGTVYVEPYAGGTPQVFLVDLRPITHPLYVPAGSLVGFDVGFGQYGDDVAPESERKKFRLDVFVFEKETTSELTAMVPDGSEKFMSTTTVLSDALLSDYLAAGLRFKCNLTFAST